MKISFQLTMPNVGSWNGKWTGASKKYYYTMSMRKKEQKDRILELLAGRPSAYYIYDFGDGWTAGITMEIVDEKECRQRTKASAGFCGYTWMVHSILKNGKIISEPKNETVTINGQQIPVTNE